MKTAMRKGMRIDEEGARLGREVVKEALERVSLVADGYLVGDKFTAADLTAASMLFPAVHPPGFPYDHPKPISGAMQEWLDLYSGHPGAEWVRAVYRHHRGEFRGVEV